MNSRQKVNLKGFVIETKQEMSTSTDQKTFMTLLFYVEQSMLAKFGNFGKF